MRRTFSQPPQISLSPKDALDPARPSACISRRGLRRLGGGCPERTRVTQLATIKHTHYHRPAERVAVDAEVGPVAGDRDVGPAARANDCALGRHSWLRGCPPPSRDICNTEGT